MLDIPGYAFVVWAAYFVLAFLKQSTRSSLLIGVVRAVLAVWTKYNMGCFLVVLGVSLLLTRGPRVLLDRTVILAAVVGIVLIAPAVGISLCSAGTILNKLTPQAKDCTAHCPPSSIMPKYFQMCWRGRQLSSLLPPLCWHYSTEGTE